MNEKIIIIGGGIAGLTLANILQKNNIDFHIYEGAKNYQPKGVGIWLGINAMQVFEHLNLTDQIYKHGRKLHRFNLINNKGKKISSLNLNRLTKKFNLYPVSILRKDLQEVLLLNIPEEKLTINKKVECIEENENEIKVVFSDRDEVIAQYLIGADGISSTVRNYLYPTLKLKPKKDLCFRGVVDIELKDEYKKAGNEFWVNGDLFGFSPLQGKTIFWWALIRSKQGKSFKLDMSSLFSHFPREVYDIVSTTKPEDILQTNIQELPLLNNFSSKSVCLLGDSAVAMLPNLGQGGSVAIESAYYLGSELTQNQSIEKSFHVYNTHYKSKVHFTKKMSKQVYKASLIKNPLFVFFRNSFMFLGQGISLHLVLMRIYRLK